MNETIKDENESYALEVAAGILDGGNSARFSKNLVRGQQIAASTGVGYELYARLDTLFMMEATPVQGQGIEALESALLGQVKKLQDEFKLVEGFFERRGNSADAVLNSKEYQDKAAAIQKSLTAGDYTTAANEANDFSKQCRGACHDKYKPL